MRACAWNCRGFKFADNLVLPYLIWIVGSQALDFLFLSEIKSSVEELQPYVSKLGFSKSKGVNAVGLARGLILFWSNRIEVSILFIAKNYVCCNVKDKCNILYYVTCICGAHILGERAQVWDNIRAFVWNHPGPHLILGDFNLVENSDQ